MKLTDQLSTVAPTSAAPEDGAPLDRLAAWLLGRPLTLAIGLLCLAEIAAWAPNYGNWPWWADHDAYATAARGWDLGVRPYRDFVCNNFPGQIYLFYILGRVAGWGYQPAFWAVDVAFVIGLGVLLGAWSLRRFGRLLPGLIGFAAFLAYYLNLDYSQAGQRDWHAPFFALAAILAAQTWPGRAGRLAAAVAVSVALTFRPQAVLFLPAIALAVVDGAHSFRKGLGILVAWSLATAILTALAFSPLWATGIGLDFVRNVRVATVGGGYYQSTPLTVLKECVDQATQSRFVLTAVVVLLLMASTKASVRGAARIWLVALCGAWLYKPLSPVHHAYLDHPLAVTWCVGLTVVAALLLESGAVRPAWKLAAALIVLGLGSPQRPRFSNPEGQAAMVSALLRHELPASKPRGYTTNPASIAAGRYEWSDYRAVLDHLRRELKPGTRVANALIFTPALTGPTGRLSAFPAESVSWVRIVRLSDEAEFVRALEKADDSVVVWDPSQPLPTGWARLDALSSTIERLYEPSARFGPIEVWKRRLETVGSKPGMSPARPPLPAAKQEASLGREHATDRRI